MRPPIYARLGLVTGIMLACVAGCTASDKDSSGSRVNAAIPHAGTTVLIGDNDGLSDSYGPFQIPEDALALVGSDEEDFIRNAEIRGYTVRVLSRDGEDFAADAVYRPGRLNIGIDHGVVVEIFSVG